MYSCIVVVLDTTSEPVKARWMPLVSTLKSTARSHAKYTLKSRSHTVNTRPYTRAMTRPIHALAQCIRRVLPCETDISHAGPTHEHAKYTIPL